MKTASYEDLLAGCRSYRSRVVEADGKRFEELARGQSPKVTLLTCSDSRIDPGLLTDTRPGDLFVIRNAGNIVPEHGGESGGEVASLEFAVKVLNTEHIVVCGHSDCGAMKGLLAPAKCAPLTHVSSWVRQAQGALVALEGVDADPEHRLERVTLANVRLQLENLRRLDFVREAEAAGKLSLHGWYHDFAAGAVRLLDAATGDRMEKAA